MNASIADQISTRDGLRRREQNTALMKILLYQLNPMVSVVQAYRDILYAGSVPKLETLSVALGMGLLFLTLGFLIFEKLKRRFSEVI